MALPKVGETFMFNNIPHLRIKTILGIYKCLKNCIFAVNMETYTVVIISPKEIEKIYYKKQPILTYVHNRLE